MADEKEIHHTLGDHGARLNSLEDGHKSLDGKIAAVDERQRRDIRKALLGLISVLSLMVVGAFEWIGERLAGLLQ